MPERHQNVNLFQADQEGLVPPHPELQALSDKFILDIAKGDGYTSDGYRRASLLDKIHQAVDGVLDRVVDTVFEPPISRKARRERNV